MHQTAKGKQWYFGMKAHVCSATIRVIKRVNQDGKFLVGRILGLLLRI
jgi:hypothetical protein